jgi:peptidoglycan/xylan/chitin deacetylase (PgdA/CDA1 family)
VYLTFDDGPWRDTNEILDILKANDVKATFFQIGKMIRTREATNERIWAEGHVIANHTWDHVDLATLGAGAITEQLQMTQDHIGPRAATCMRPPYGSLNAKARGIAQSFGLTPILWTRDTNDWARSATSGSIYSTLMRTVPGDVVLMHDGGGDRQATVDALREALPKLKAKGYHFGIVPACRIPEQAK